MDGATAMMSSMVSMEDELMASNASLDKSNLGMSEFNPGQKSKEKYVDLREVYIENYGVQMEVPSLGFRDGKMVPGQEDYVVTTDFHIIPKKQMYQNNVQTTHIDGSYEENSWDEIYPTAGESIRLTLNKIEGRNGFTRIKTIPITGAKKLLIKFSNSGKYFAIFNVDDFQLTIYDSQDIFQCFDNIEKKQPMLKIDLENKQFKAKAIVFDLRDNYLAIYSETQILIFCMKKEDFGKESTDFSIDSDQYTNILDLLLDSQPENPHEQLASAPFHCMIACKVNFITNVQIFDINLTHNVKFISYVKNKDKLKVHISDDMQSVFLSVGQENYILNDEQQTNFPWVKDKFVRATVNIGKGYYLFLTKNYDRDIDILHTLNNEFEASMDRSIEPGIFKVLDQFVNSQGQIKALSMLGSRLYIDTIEVDEYVPGGDTTERNHCIGSVMEQADHAFGFNWPYFSYVTKDNDIFILNAFNKQFIQRYRVPQNVTYISHTFLSDTHDFYCICETKDEIFEVFNIDLDSEDPQILGPILSYPYNAVDSEAVVGFHARGSSRKEKINLNKQTMVFMLHGKKLVGWDGTGVHEVISTNARNMYYLSDDKVFFMETHDHQYGHTQVEHSKIKLVECLFGSYKINKIYEDKDQRAEILNFGVDNTRERLIVLTGIKNQKGRRDKFVTLYDIKQEHLAYQIRIENPEIIGRLKSNLYNFVEGHIYYNNKVIKIRYDLIDQMKGAEIKENQLFDHYSNIIKLKHKSDFIASGTPLQTCLYNRLAYIIKNNDSQKPDKIMILPYLHERRIYLNRRHQSEQFYSICNYNDKNFILCLCINDDKLYVYTETGILKKRIRYPEIKEKHGKPESISENGFKILFTKSKTSEHIAMVQMDTNGLRVLEDINYVEKLRDHIDGLRISNPKKYKEIKYFWDNYLGQCKNMKNVKTLFTLNDSGDVLIRIRPTTEFALKKQKQLDDVNMFDDDNQESKLKQDVISQCSIFLYLPSKDDYSFYQGFQEYMYYDSESDELYDIQGTSMNQQFIFFWNYGIVWALNLATQVINKLSIYISEEEKQTFVKRVRCGTNKNVIAIRITQSSLKDVIIQWDLKNDREISSYDIDSRAVTFQDPIGNTFVLEHDWIINCKTGCKLKCYAAQSSDFYGGKFGFQYGHRMENKTNNWVIFRNFINLSFSYMTFVIKENFDLNSFAMVDYLFDIEGYDYVLNRNTVFTQGSLVTGEFEKLDFILNNYNKLSPIYLESLHYQNREGKVALHLALAANNNQMVNLILNYMSKIEFAAVNLIKDIFKDLINIQNFSEYLNAIPFQTKQMQNKQTLNLMLTREQAKNMDILVCTPSNVQYVDGVYFTNVMKEKKDNKNALTYAVKIKSINADWIINDEDGLGFLQELIRQNNKEMFETPYIEIIIEFLYNKFSAKIIKGIMPLFLLNYIFIFLMIFFAERQRKSEEQEHTAYIITVYICFIISLINFGILGLQTHNIGLRMQMTRGWAILDFLIFILNLTVLIQSFTEENVVQKRIIEALLLVVITMKSLYFLRLFGEIAPLIDIVFVIIGDIQSFVLIFLIAMLCFIMSFYIIGQNQLDVAETEDDIPPYATIVGAFDHVFRSSLGDFDTDFYFENDMTPILLFLFIIMTFMMLLHLLNMLIAIMGESFANNAQHKEAKKQFSQLSFVVENWWLDSISPIENKKSIVHLIAAFPMEYFNHDKDADKLRFQNLEDRMNGLQGTQNQIMNHLKDKTDDIFKIQNIMLSEIKALKGGVDEDTHEEN